MSNKYYQWINDFSFPSPKEIIIPESWNEFDLFGGKKINKKMPPMQLLFDDAKELSDAIPNKEIFLFFSKRLVGFIKDNYPGDLIQTFPIEIKTQQKTAAEDYFLINILNSRDVIDKKRSKLKMDKYGDILKIESLEIVDEDFDNNDFFRLEDFSGLLICSESFVRSLGENNFKGMKFTPTSKLFI